MIVRVRASLVSTTAGPGTNRRHRCLRHDRLAAPGGRGFEMSRSKADEVTLLLSKAEHKTVVRGDRARDRRSRR